MAGRRYWRLNRQSPSRLMAATTLQLDFELSGLKSNWALITALLPISAFRRLQGLVPGTETGRFEPLSQAGQLWFAKCHASCGEEGMPLEENRRSKPTLSRPDFPRKPKVSLRLDQGLKPAWVAWQLSICDAGMTTLPESVSTSYERQGACARAGSQDGHLGVGMCRELCEDGRIADAVDALNLLVQQGTRVSTSLFYSVLKRCKDLDLGRRVHALTVNCGYEGEAFLATHLMGLYASHGKLEEAMQVFSKVSLPTVYNWTTIIFAHARHGEAAQVIRLYQQMLDTSTVKPTNQIYVAVLKACATARDLVVGKEVHAHILSTPGKPDIFVHTGLINMYASCRRLEDAHKVFAELPERDVVTWNALLAGYAQQGMGQEGLGLYSSMQAEGIIPPNSVTFICILQACASVGVGGLDQGKEVHAQIEERGLLGDVVVCGSLVNMYSKCGSLEDARSLFDRLPARNIVIWNAMIAAYAQKEMGEEALSLHSTMQQETLTPNLVTYVCLLQACASIGVEALDQGKQLHEQIEERGLQDDLVVGGSLVNMYAKCGSLGEARRVFDRLPARNGVTWNAMIAGYAQQGMGQDALNLYSTMQQEGLIPPDSVAFVCLLQACASVGVGALNQGKQLHAQIEELGLQDDVVLSGSLVNMYSKCGSLGDARSLFDRLPDRSVVTWTAMIAGYAQQDMGQEALSLYSSMQQEGNNINPNSVTFVCLLQACASVAALPLGKQLHLQIEERGLQADVVVGTSLVNMYAKCGHMLDSQRVFDSLPERTIEAWGALTGGYARQGESDVVFDLFDRMRLEGIQPDGITFISVLTVCSHAGLVDKGRDYFEAMSAEHGIDPTVDHYICMMDLLGRAGHLDEALQMAKTMPFPANDVVWLTLLGACRKWKNVEIGQKAFESAVRMDGKGASSYVLMSSIYAGAEMWEEAREIQARRMKSGAWKKPGQSWWTDMGGVVHAFGVGD